MIVRLQKVVCLFWKIHFRKIAVKNSSSRFFARSHCLCDTAYFLPEVNIFRISAHKSGSWLRGFLVLFDFPFYRVYSKKCAAFLDHLSKPKVNHVTYLLHFEIISPGGYLSDLASLSLNSKLTLMFSTSKKYADPDGRRLAFA